MAVPPVPPKLNPLLDWCQKHPRTMVYLLVVTTANLLLNILNTAGVT